MVLLTHEENVQTMRFCDFFWCYSSCEYTVSLGDYYKDLFPILVCGSGLSIFME